MRKELCGTPAKALYSVSYELRVWRVYYLDFAPSNNLSHTSIAPPPTAPNSEMDTATVYNFYQRKLFTDVTIVFSGEREECHRLILASASEYFEKLLDKDSPFKVSASPNCQASTYR